MVTAILEDGTLQLIPQDGPPVEPGWYLVRYERRRETVEQYREVRIDGTGNLNYGPDAARCVWLYRLVWAASGVGLIRGADKAGEVSGDTKPATPGREVVCDGLIVRHKPTGTYSISDNDDPDFPARGPLEKAFVWPADGFDPSNFDLYDGEELVKVRVRETTTIEVVE